MPDEPVVHVVDDDDGVRQSLSFLLGCSDIPTRTYESAMQFLKAVPAMERGCIITDVRMPEMSGLELVARLKSLGVNDPVIVITGHADVPMAIEALHKGVSDFIEKPFSDEVLIESITRAASRAAERVQSESALEAVRQRVASLSERERQVLKGVVAGQPNKTIAFELGISPRTVEVYRAGLMGKMQARSLPELVRMVMDVTIDSP